MNDLILIAVLHSVSPRWVAPLHGWHNCEHPECPASPAVYSCAAMPLGYVETCDLHAMALVVERVAEGCGVFHG